MLPWPADMDAKVKAIKAYAVVDKNGDIDDLFLTDKRAKEWAKERDRDERTYYTDGEGFGPHRVVKLAGR